MNIFFQIHKWRNYFGSFTSIIALKSNNSYCYVLSREEADKGARGEGPGKLSKSRLLYFRETPFLIKRGHSKKGTFAHLLKRVGV